MPRRYWVSSVNQAGAACSAMSCTGRYSTPACSWPPGLSRVISTIGVSAGSVVEIGERGDQPGGLP